MGNMDAPEDVLVPPLLPIAIDRVAGTSAGAVAAAAVVVVGTADAAVLVGLGLL